MGILKSGEDKSTKSKSIIREYVEALIIALVLAMIIRTFVVQAFKIPSESMLPTLLVGDHLLVNKFSYGVKIPFSDKYLYEGSDPELNDVVVFEYPNNPELDYIKRVIGLPGDKIEVRNKQLFRNDELISEDFIENRDPNFNVPTRDDFGPVVVPDGKFFVMGDSRDNSQDSRFWGFVDKSAMHGKAWRIYWSSGGIDQVRWGRFGKAIE